MNDPRGAAHLLILHARFSPRYAEFYQPPDSVGTRLPCQAVINVSSYALVEIFGRLRGVPTQLSATVTSGTRIVPHLQKVPVELIALVAQISFGQLNGFGGCDLPTCIKRLGNLFRRIPLPVLPAVEEVISLVAGILLFPGFDRVEEEVEELANL